MDAKMNAGTFLRDGEENRFTVVIPLYNGEKYIIRALDSVFGQVHALREVIVVNDGSTDTGVEIISMRYGEKVKILDQKNQGVSTARNKGADAASFPWVAFLDSDDVWLPNHLEELSRQINKFPNVALVANGNLQLNTLQKPPQQSEPGNIRKIDYLLEASKKMSIVHSSCVAVLKSVIESHGGFKPYAYGEDLEMWARVSLFYEVSVSDCITAVYYRGTDGAIERLNKGKGCRAKRRIASLADVSPTIQMLCENGVENNDNSRSYICSVIKMMVKQDILTKDIERARQLSGLMPESESLGLFIKLILSLPNRAIEMAIDFRRAVRG